jgi:hypothetical protein
MTMGKLNGSYNADFPIGTTVRIAQRSVLEDFLKNWKLHNPIMPEQLDFAEYVGEIDWLGYYHGGDELYRLRGVPGIWHAQFLERVS